MLLLKSLACNAIFSVFFLLFASRGGAVLELGEAELFGKKDRPEAMIFLSRTPVDDSVLVPEWKVSHKIEEAISDDIFKVPSAE